MSRTLFKKELSTFTREQLIGLLLETYDARSEFKEYFEYFLNPQPERLLERAVNALRKELERVKWGRSKTRVTRLRSTIAEFEGFKPGVEYVLQLYFFTIDALIDMAQMRHRLNETQFNAIGRLIAESFTYAQREEAHDLWLQKYQVVMTRVRPQSDLHLSIAEALESAKQALAKKKGK